VTDSESLLAFVCSPAHDDTGAVFTYRIRPDRREMERVDAVTSASAKFLTLDRERGRLYAANGAGGGRVTAYSYDEDGTLTELNRRSSGGENPAYVSLDADGEYLFAANYTAGSVSMLPVGDDGELGAATSVVEHEGSSVNPDRQSEPHPHSIGPGPGNEFVYAPDLGTDQVMIYRIDRENEELVPAETPYAEVHDGAGPRHFAVHPDGEYLYVINELDSTITVFEYESGTGALSEQQTLSTLPERFDGESYTAEVQAHPSGRWVYGSNRGHDSIAICETRDDGGALGPPRLESTRGEWPRHFAIGPRGETLFAENRDSGSIVPFDVGDDGGPTPWATTESVTEPICMVFADSR